jgi:hypothetical protein
MKENNDMRADSKRRITGPLQLLAASLLLFSAAVTASEAEDRFLIMELQDRYGFVHDFGTAEEYADLFTADGEIGTRTKGRQALIEQAKRDHEKYSAPPGPDGKVSSIMRHIISNRVVKLMSRYVDRYARTKDGWRIAHRDIVLESGNREIGKRFGFGR